MSKTPISVLMEYLTIKRLKAPIFEEIDRFGPPHMPIFRVQVIADGKKAEGEACNKKDAKQKAAENLMNILGIKNHNSSELSSVNNNQACAVDKNINDNNFKDPDSVYKENGVVDEVNFNAIGALTDLCKRNSFPLPDFKILKEEGPDHLKTFTMECCVFPISGSGIANKKQKAMHIAANKVLQQIQKELEEKKESRRVQAVKKTCTRSSEAIIKKYQNIKDPIRINKSSTSVFDCHNNYEKIQNNSPTLKKLISEEAEIEDDPCNLVEKIANELDVKLVIKPMDTKELKGTPKSEITMMRLATELPIISLGYNIDDAAANLIDNLKVLCG